MCEDFAPKFGDRTGCCITTTYRLTFLFHQGIFDQKHDGIPHQRYFSLSLIKNKSDKPPF
jgi:hypothetical protein